MYNVIFWSGWGKNYILDTHTYRGEERIKCIKIRDLNTLNLSERYPVALCTILVVFCVSEIKSK